MEHKISSAVRKAKRIEPCHRCGTCKNYTESRFEGDVGIWEEYCYAGKSVEHMHHTVDCDSWGKA